MTNLMAPTVRKDAGQKRRLLSLFKKDKRGSVAIEFSMLAMPFCLLVFAIIESSLSFSAQQVMTSAADTLARDIRVERLSQANATGTIVRNRICDRLSTWVSTGCPGLVVDLKVYASFADVPTTIPRQADKDVDATGFATNVGIGKDIQHLRVFYRWPYITDFIGHKLAELPDNKTLLFASATWKNEDF